MGAPAVAALDVRDVLVGLVGEDRLEAVAVVVGEAQLRTGVRALPAHDHARALGPGAQLDAVGDLGDLAVVALAGVLIERRHPSICGDLEDRGADRLGQLVADREAQVRLAAVVDQAVRGAGRVGAHEDLDLLDVLGGDLLERPVEHRDVVGGGVRAGVPGSQQTAERLARLIRIRVQRVEPVAALVVAGRVLLLRMRGDQRRIDVERQPLGRVVQLPEPLPRSRVRHTQRLQQRRVARDSLDHPKRGRVRRDRPEQRLPITHRAEIRDALAAVGEHHRQIADHAARVMPATALLDRGQPQRQRLREPEPVGHPSQQRTARVRHQTRSVRRDFYGYRASITHHLQGEPPSSSLRPSASRRIAAQPDVSAPPHTGGAVVTARSGPSKRPTCVSRETLLRASPSRESCSAVVASMAAPLATAVHMNAPGPSSAAPVRPSGRNLRRRFT
jgi:hypothetical protein